MHLHDKVMHDLLCRSLREADVLKLTTIELASFNYKLGVALHNIPHELRENNALSREVCFALNEIDPSARVKDDQWGDWVSAALDSLGQDLPYI